MKTKLMMLATAVVATMPTMAATQYANGYTWTYQINGNTAEIFNDRDAAISPSPTGAVTIPSMLGGKPVTSIGDFALDCCDGLTGVTIPDSVTNIGKYAFYGCRKLTDVTISDCVTSIGNLAFCECSGLTSVIIGGGVTNVGDGIFWNCSRLMSILVASENINYKSIDGLLLTKDGKTVIEGVNGNVAIPNSVTNIRNQAFDGRSGLAMVTMPDSVKVIGAYAFHSCSGLTNLTISGGLTSIYSYVFSGCSGLTSVTIPDSVARIENGAFSGCYGLTNVTIGTGVTYIGDNGFERCRDSLFDTTTFPGVKLVDGWAVGNTGGLSGDLNLAGVRGIGGKAFYGCKELTSVTIPDGVKDIAEWTFYNCSALTNVIIGNGVTSIGNYAFDKCSRLRSVTIPDTVMSIGCCAFEDCSMLTNVTIPDSVTNIDIYAFCRCSRLTSVTIPPNVTSIGSYAFRDSNVRRAYLPKGLGVGSAFPENTVFYRYAPNQTATLNPNGGTCSKERVDVSFGKAYGDLPIPSRVGCSFGGWMLDGATVSSNTVVSALDDHVLVAQWKCTVLFDANGGVCSTETATVEHGASIGTLPVPTRANAAFRGWFTKAEGGGKVDRTLAVTEGMTLYAHWLFEVANPVIMTDGGVEFRMDSCEVTITSATEGATIYYTDDKTTPKKNDDYLYSGPITITETTTFKAVAVVGGISSGYVTVTITKRPLTLEEALGVGEGDTVSIATSETLPWVPVLDPSAKMGGSSARSGAIGNGTNTWLSVSVSGAGTISFWCKTSCEHDDDGTFTWDRLMVYTNDVEIVDWRMDGEMDWTERSFAFDGGENTVKWVYYKDNSYAEGEDCAWVDSVTWTPTDSIPAIASDGEVAAALAGTTDVNLTANVTNAAQYAAYRTWALSVTNATTTTQMVKESTRTWLSYAFAADALIDKELTSDDVKIESFTPASTDGKFEFTVSVKDVNIGGGSVAVETLKENLKKVLGIEGSATLSPGGFSSDNIDITFDTPVDGKARFIVSPPADAGNSFFMRVKVK